MKTTLSCGALLLFSTLSLAQSPPWTVTLTPTLNPLPLGMCGAVHLTLYDPATRDVPRNPQGFRITMADFDMSVIGGSAAGQNLDPSHYQACGCQGGAAGSTATVTAAYPRQSLPTAARVPNVTFQKTASFVLALPKGTVNPPPCVLSASVPPSQTLPSTPPPAVTGSPVGQVSAADPTTKTPTAIVPPPSPSGPPPVPENPIGARAEVTGPAPGFVRDPGEVLLSWWPVKEASFYVVFGPGLAPGGQRVEQDSYAPFILSSGNGSLEYENRSIVVAKNVPNGPQEWLVASYYMPGNISTTADKFTKIRWNMETAAP